MKKYFIFVIIIGFLNSCGSIKSTIKNIDNTVAKPQIKDGAFIITEYSNDTKYGYNQDYPINLGFNNEKESLKNVDYFFKALSGKNGETISYVKLESCCPFPTKRTSVGAGTLDVYEITFEGTDKKAILYLNIYEKGKIMCPNGFSIKRFQQLGK